mgnify:CR=1 FL=1
MTELCLIPLPTNKLQNNLYKNCDEESITRAINSFVSPKAEKFLPFESPANVPQSVGEMTINFHRHLPR